jgi:predicted dienelactone hydrolase
MQYNPFKRGKYPVGVRTARLTDEARAGGRTFPLEIWYPATADYRGQDLDEATRDRFKPAEMLPEKSQDAVRNAEPESGQFPLILYSHCAVSHRRDAAFLCAHLASHGYVVAAPEFIGDTSGEILIDAANAENGAATLRAAPETITTNRPQDALFALDSLLSGGDPIIAGHIDRENIGVCGVSLGGWTTLRILSLDRQPKAAFVAAPSWGLSGPFPDTKLQHSLVQLDDWGRAVPIFLLAGERDALVVLDDMRELHSRLPLPKCFAVLRGASHFHWGEGAEELYEMFKSMWENGSLPGADVAALTKNSPPFSELCPNWHATVTLQALCLAQMDEHLKRNADAKAFLENDLVKEFALRGIDLEAVL